MVVINIFTREERGVFLRGSRVFRIDKRKTERSVSMMLFSWTTFRFNPVFFLFLNFFLRKTRELQDWGPTYDFDLNFVFYESMTRRN